jgi:hypothetical protein
MGDERRIEHRYVNEAFPAPGNSRRCVMSIRNAIMWVCLGCATAALVSCDKVAVKDDAGPGVGTDTTQVAGAVPATSKKIKFEEASSGIGYTVTGPDLAFDKPLAGAIPARRGDRAEKVTVSGSSTIPAGASGTFAYHAEGASALLVGIEELGGHYRIPVASDRPDSYFIVTLADDVEPGQLTLTLVPEFEADVLGEETKVPFSTGTSGTGDLQVYLSWRDSTADANSADMDLLLQEPSDGLPPAELIAFYHMKSASGGALEADCNHFCDSATVPDCLDDPLLWENVTYKCGESSCTDGKDNDSDGSTDEASPKGGRYQVKLSLWSICDEQISVLIPWTVTIKMHNAVSQVCTGTFIAQDEARGPQVVCEFNYCPNGWGCCGTGQCTNAPQNSCAGNTLNTYAAAGTCGADHQCHYTATPVTCDYGCVDAASPAADYCASNPCNGTVCDNPPYSECVKVGAIDYLRSYAMPGTCYGKCNPGGAACNPALSGQCTGGVCNGPASCVYGQTDTLCTYGCVAQTGPDKCFDPCEGKVCSTPPGKTCNPVCDETSCTDSIDNDSDGTTDELTPVGNLVSYDSVGTCSGNGTCSYTHWTTNCFASPWGYGCSNGHCRNCTNDDNCSGSEICIDGLCQKRRLFFREFVRYPSDYKGHEIWIGPAGNSDPEGGGWAQVADATALLPITGSAWVDRPPVDFDPSAAPPAGIGASTFRLAFRYTGLSGDEWYLEDVCFAQTTGTAYPPTSDCIFLSGFDTATAPALPPGWEVVAGAANQSTAPWVGSTARYVSSPNAARVTFDTGKYKDYWLLSPAISVCDPGDECCVGVTCPPSTNLPTCSGNNLTTTPTVCNMAAVPNNKCEDGTPSVVACSVAKGGCITVADPAPDFCSECNDDTDCTSGWICNVTAHMCEPPVPIKLFFRENVQVVSDYAGHQILIGPASSTNPEDGQWAVVANSSLLKPTAGNENTWVNKGAFDLTTFMGTKKRLAFRYTGLDADNWRVDDVCVVKTAGSSMPANPQTDCDVFVQGFEGTSGTALPPLWSDFAGMGNQSAAGWGTTNAVSFPPSARSVSITYSTGQFKNHYLVTEPLSMCYDGDECCANSMCDAPPVDKCEATAPGSNLRQYLAEGVCTAGGTCDYSASYTPLTCDYGCEVRDPVPDVDDVCMANPCFTESCVTPPADVCGPYCGEGNCSNGIDDDNDGATDESVAAGQLAMFDSVGTCDPLDTPLCDYLFTEVDCATGCSATPCLEASCTNSIDDDGDGTTDEKDTTAGCNYDWCEDNFCDVQPAPECCDTTSGCDYDDSRKIFDTIGTCTSLPASPLYAAHCAHDYNQEVCAFGCSGGLCNPDPCANVTCATKSPDNECQVSGDLRVFDSVGVCVPDLSGNATDDDGTPLGLICKYNHTDTTCQWGCQAKAGDDECKQNPCVGVLCDSPPDNECSGSNLIEYDMVGLCRENKDGNGPDHAGTIGMCQYGSSSTACGVAGCVTKAGDDVCGDDPCETVTCNNPPDNECCTGANGCVVGSLKVWDSNGTCSGGACSYTGFTTINCGVPGCTVVAGDDVCKSGLCDGVVCGAADPDVCCDGTGCPLGSLQDYSSTAKCDSATGLCSTASVVTACSFGCNTTPNPDVCKTDPCLTADCTPTNPVHPKNVCQAGNKLRTYLDNGRCSNSGSPLWNPVCTWDYMDVQCAYLCNPSGGPGDDQCIANPCDSITCGSVAPNNWKPADLCCNGTNGCNAPNSRVFATTGICHPTGVWNGTDTNHRCEYQNFDQACSAGCASGHCNVDTCIGVTCNTPPADTCAALTLKKYDAVGTCNPALPVGSNCVYGFTNISCAQRCVAGSPGYCDMPCVSTTCSSPPTPNPVCVSGDLRVYNTVGNCAVTGVSPYYSCTYPYQTVSCNGNGCDAAASPDACINNAPTLCDAFNACPDANAPWQCNGYVSQQRGPATGCHISAGLKVCEYNGSWVDKQYCPWGCTAGSPPTCNSMPAQCAADEVPEAFYSGGLPGVAPCWKRCPVGQTWDATYEVCVGTPSTNPLATQQSACKPGHHLATETEMQRMRGGAALSCASSAPCTAMFGVDKRQYWIETPDYRQVDFSTGAVTTGAATPYRYARCVDGESYCLPNPCTTPPNSQCQSSTTLRTYSGTGTCATSGVSPFYTCSGFGYADTTCTDGCIDIAGNDYCLQSCGVDISNLTPATDGRWDFKAGDMGWTRAGAWRLDWGGANPSPSPDRSLSYWQFNNYASSVAGDDATTASGSLSNCATCTVNLSFSYQGQTESGYDFVTPACSGDGGASWQNLVTPGLSGAAAAWTAAGPYPVPPACKTATARFRFRFNSDGSTVYAGFRVDNVRLYSTATTANQPIGDVNTASMTEFTGWTCDKDTSDSQLPTRLAFYKNASGTPSTKTVTANVSREPAVGTACASTHNNHGWTYSVSGDAALTAFLGTGRHLFRAYALDLPASTCTGHYFEIPNSPKWVCNGNADYTASFECGGALSAFWTASSWAISANYATSGSYSAASTNTGNNSTGYLQAVKTTLAGNIGFYWMGSSESPDKFRFKVDAGAYLVNTGGSHQSWSYASQAVTAASHTFRWEYAKDGSTSSYWDKWYVDDITFPGLACGSIPEC